MTNNDGRFIHNPDNSNENRETGRTTAAIQNAPLRSIYIVNSLEQVVYVREVASRIGRNDIRVFSVEQIEFIMGTTAPAIVVDHSVTLSYDDEYMLRLLIRWVEQS